MYRGSGKSSAPARRRIRKMGCIAAVYRGLTIAVRYGAIPARRTAEVARCLRHAAGQTDGDGVAGPIEIGPLLLTRDAEGCRFTLAAPAQITLNIPKDYDRVLVAELDKVAPSG